MQKTLLFNSQSLLLLQPSLSFNSNSNMDIPLVKSSTLFTLSNLSIFNQNSSLSFSLWNHQTQIQNAIICARNNRRRIGYQRSRKFILESICFVASNLNILPQPLALAIREFGGGNGGGFWIGKGYGGEGFDGWRRKKTKSNLGLLIVCGMGLWFYLGKELDIDVLCGVLALSLLGVSINGWKRGVKDWILGFCFCAVLVSLGLRRGNFQRWEKGFGAMEVLRSRRKRKRVI